MNTTTTSSQNDFWTLNIDYDNFVFTDYVNNIESDSYYEVTLNTVLDVSFSEFMNIRIPYVVLGDRVLVLGDNASNIKKYSSTSLKTFVFSGAELQDELAVKLKGYVFKKGGFITNFNSNITISVQSCRLISSDSSNSYQDGYEAGYSVGEEFGYSSGYNNGFSDGESEGFEEGFEAGKDSVDVDSIYMDGYNAGSEAAYVEGFDEGYLRGYAEALSSSSSSLNSTSMVPGNKFTVPHSNVIYALPLGTKHFNTKYGAFSVLDDSETYVHLEGSFDGYYYDDPDYFGDIYLTDDFKTYYEQYIYGFHQSSTFFEFNTSPDVYAYRITVKPSRVNYSVTNRTIDTRLVLGTQSEIYSGEGLIGESFSNGSNRNSVFWYVNDYKSVPLCTSYLTQFYLISLDETTDFSLNWDYVLDVVPYTKQEYNASVSAIEKQTLEIKKQTLEMEEQTEELQEQTETQKGMLSKMSEFFGGFFDNLKNAVIGLFVPSQEEMGSLFDRLMQFFNDTFGFLFYPFDFIVRLVELFLTSTNDNTSIVFPGFSIMGMQVWETMEIDLAEYEVTRELFGYVRMVTGAIIAFGFIDYLRKYFDKRFGGGGS